MEFIAVGTSIRFCNDLATLIEMNRIFATGSFKFFKTKGSNLSKITSAGATKPTYYMAYIAVPLKTCPLSF